MIKKKLISILLIIPLLLTACGGNLPIETDMNEKVNDFSFTNQHKETVGLKELKGQWWLADFVFTNCETVCLPMTSNMAMLQERLKEKGIPLQLVSFSVDPEHDTPDVLKAYGDEYGADFTSWHFLTGYHFKTIRELSIKSFRALTKKPEYGDDQVMHDIRFFLVDPDGEVIKGYEGVSRDGIEEIMRDMLVLQKKDLL
jgi:protein SCO1/2